MGSFDVLLIKSPVDYHKLGSSIAEASFQLIRSMGALGPVMLATVLK